MRTVHWLFIVSVLLFLSGIGIVLYLLSTYL